MLVFSHCVPFWGNKKKRSLETSAPVSPGSIRFSFQINRSIIRRLSYFSINPLVMGHAGLECVSFGIAAVTRFITLGVISCRGVCFARPRLNAFSESPHFVSFHTSVFFSHIQFIYKSQINTAQLPETFFVLKKGPFIYQPSLESAVHYSQNTALNNQGNKVFPLFWSSMWLWFILYYSIVSWDAVSMNWTRDFCEKSVMRAQESGST